MCMMRLLLVCVELLHVHIMQTATVHVKWDWCGLKPMERISLHKIAEDQEQRQNSKLKRRLYSYMDMCDVLHAYTVHI